MSRLAGFKDLSETKAVLSITDNAEEMSTKAAPSFRITSDANIPHHALFKSLLKCQDSLDLIEGGAEEGGIHPVSRGSTARVL